MPLCNRHSGNNPFRKTVAVHPLNTKSRCSWKDLVLHRIHLHSGYRTPFVYDWGLILDEKQKIIIPVGPQFFPVKVHWPNWPNWSNLHLFTNSFHGLLRVIDPILRLFGDSKGDVESMYEALVPLKGHESMQRTIDFKRVENQSPDSSAFYEIGSSNQQARYQGCLLLWYTMVTFASTCLIQSVFTQHFADAT